MRGTCDSLSELKFIHTHCNRPEVDDGLNEGRLNLCRLVCVVSVVQDAQVPGDYLVFQHCSGGNVDPVSVISDDDHRALKRRGNVRRVYFRNYKDRTKCIVK